MRAPWIELSDAPVIEQCIHDYVVSIFRMQRSKLRNVEIVPISPGAEAHRGWDAAVREVVPLYFQYKLPDFTSRPQHFQKSAYARRKLWMFDDAGGVFHFPLRKKSKSAPRSQHALLVAMQNSGERVFYVAPTFVDHERLRRGGKLVNGRAWANSHVSMATFDLLERIVTPYLMDLICIPPHVDVDGPPEKHKFVFNVGHEVSLHSEPTVVDGRNLFDVVSDQIMFLREANQRVVKPENVSDYANKILRLVSGADDARFHALLNYFNSLEPRGAMAERTLLMTTMSSLAKVVKRTTGLQMLLTIRKEI